MRQQLSVSGKVIDVDCAVRPQHARSCRVTHLSEWSPRRPGGGAATAPRIRCLQPKYRWVVWTETWPGRNWISSLVIQKQGRKNSNEWRSDGPCSLLAASHRIFRLHWRGKTRDE